MPKLKGGGGEGGANTPSRNPMLFQSRLAFPLFQELWTLELWTLDFSVSVSVCVCVHTYFCSEKEKLRADFWEGDATKHFSVKKRGSEKGGGNSVNEGFGRDFYRKGNSVKRFGPFSEPPDSEN